MKMATYVVILVTLLLPGGNRPSIREAPTVSLTYATFLGGSGVDDCDGLSLDRNGTLVLGCHSDSTDLPIGGSPAYRIKGDLDAFVIRLSEDGRRVQSLTQIGGSDWEAVMDVAVDARGFAYVVGTTFSPNLPTTSDALRRSYGGGEGDAFVARLSPAGAILWLTYLGGTGLDDGRRIVVDGAGHAYVAGRTGSPDFPTTRNAFQPSPGSNGDAFVTKLDSSGRLIYSTYLGGSEQDIAWGLAVDRSGNAHVTGDTKSRNFPRNGPLQATMRGDADCFITILDVSGNRLLFSTYWGGSAWDSGNAIAVDSAGRIFVTGWVHSDDFPVTSGVLQTVYGGNHDAFVSSFEPLGRAVRYSTYIGGDRDDSGTQVIPAPAGAVWVIGGTESANFPTMRPYQTSLRGTKDGFVTMINAAGTSAIYSTYLGGGGRELFEDAEAAAGNGLVVSGLTASRDFPTVKPFRSSLAGGMYDIVVARFMVGR